MNWKRPAVIVIVGAAVGAWLTAAMTVPGGAPVRVPAARPSSVDLKGAALASEIARLHERLRPDAAPRQPSRNLFTFNSGVRSTSQATVPAPVVPAAPATTQPALKLSGIAEDAGAGGPIRTAIISGAGQLFLVKEGETVTTRYRVSKILEDGVDLIDVENDSTRHLALK